MLGLESYFINFLFTNEGVVVWRCIISIYLMDYKVPKYLTTTVENLYNEYIEEYGQQVILKLTESKKTKIYQAVACFVYNAMYQVSFGRDEVPVVLHKETYSLPLIYNGTKVNRKVSYTFSRSVFDWLHYSGRGNLTVGCIGSWVMKGGILVPDKTISSSMRLSEELYEHLKTICYKSRIPTIPSVLEIRNSDKKPVVTPLPFYQKEVVQMLNKYNKMTRSSMIEVGEECYDIQLKKVYNNSSFEQGGRSFVIGDGAKIMERGIRPKIRIDGEPTVEIDFKSLHPRIAATLDGIELDVDFDPYAITLPNYEDRTCRYFGKFASLILLNSGISVDPKGVASWWESRRNLANMMFVEGVVPKLVEEGKCPKFIDYTAIIEAIVERNDYIRLWFHEPKGLLLQNIDSKIMDLVIGHFNSIGEVIIPVHDSIIVKERFKDEGIEVMRGCFEQVLGSSHNCVIEVK